MKVFPTGLQVLRNRFIFKNHCVFEKPILGPGESSPIWRNAPQIGIADPGKCFGIFDDFLSYTTAHEGWVSTLTDSGSAAGTDAAGGILKILPSDHTVADNDEAYIHNQNEVFLLSPGVKIFAETMLKIKEANTDDANVVFGLFDQASADDTVQNNGGGPPANYDGCCIFKVDGGTVWQAEVSNGAAQTTKNNIFPVTSNTWIRLGFVLDSTQADFYCNGQKVGTLTTNIPDGSEMRLRIGVKNGGANQEELYVDWVKIVQTR